MTELVSGCTCDACAIKPTRNSLLKAVRFENMSAAKAPDWAGLSVEQLAANRERLMSTADTWRRRIAELEVRIFGRVISQSRVITTP